ncbi:uracil-DNA glycosylase family protein [Thalassotalea crassostreae]|uniref:uracil-DNA glycosylase family protein n=1 Tax=Thalassotalea crassostreae TaxID=1763536 RepID=UPI000AFAF1D0|nr:uracil-DNA glycosylase family protein [Thalassotalea crassostreae]
MKSIDVEQQFNSLIRDVRSCEICSEYLPLGPRPVVQLDRQSRILIVGQAPGLKVHKSGIPFDDASGNRLRDWLGMSKEEFYDPKSVAILPMGFCYPGKGASGDLPPRSECAKAWRQKLLAQLTAVELTLVIGQYAQAYHLPDAVNSVTDNVLAWQEYWPNVVPLPHPSPRNNPWLTRNPWFANELVPKLRSRVEEILAKPR